MPITKDDLFRARVIEFQVQKTLGGMQPLTYLTGALNSVELAEALVGLCRLTPGQRFMNMVHRDDDVSRWVDFLLHEQKRKDSPWKKDDLKPIPEKLKEWRASLDTGGTRDVAVCQLEQALINIVPDLIAEERVRMGLRAFRTMLWRLRTGGGQE